MDGPCAWIAPVPLWFAPHTFWGRIIDLADSFLVPLLLGFALSCALFSITLQRPISIPEALNASQSFVQQLAHQGQTMLTKGWTMFCDLHVGALPDPEGFHGPFMETNMDTFKCSININHPVPKPGLDFTILHTWLLVGCFITLLCFYWLYSPDQPSIDPIDAPPPEPQSRWMRRRYAQAYRRWKRRENRSKGASIRNYGCNQKYPSIFDHLELTTRKHPPLHSTHSRWFAPLVSQVSASSLWSSSSSSVCSCPCASQEGRELASEETRRSPATAQAQTHATHQNAAPC
ncbi:unknown protein [Seminavis robusta]|uniref:Uncharacterized protein n=1 Tax=Seminavis robusta TaxID=568900 RepID=A0A9N8E7J9_9STRA|nr:unknown protein [Seminavis robusta]|eukprot:Sro597_g172920.1 n/a (289) ;mRNA; r:43519-44385